MRQKIARRLQKLQSSSTAFDQIDLELLIKRLATKKKNDINIYRIGSCSQDERNIGRKFLGIIQPMLLEQKPSSFMYPGSKNVDQGP